jgi:hypothetical protein
MRVDPKVLVFVEQGLAAGLSQDSVVGILSAHGWPDREIYAALGEHYTRTMGIQVPSRTSAGTSAKDAFFYLLIFSTLATWTIGFGTLAFALIDRWLADPLFSRLNPILNSDAISSSLAALIIAFPIYLLVSRTVALDSAAHPEKLDSGVRKWLTYMALVIAACVFMGDLIAALAYLLRGEITSRFLAKAAVVLLLSGGVFFYYFGGLRRTDAQDSPAPRIPDRLMVLISSALVLLIAILGFSQSGAPGARRELRADAERLQRLYQLSTAINSYWNSHGKLPQTLAEISAGKEADPVTGQPYGYHLKDGSTYELCTTFTRPNNAGNADPMQRMWDHPAGYACIGFDPGTPVTMPPFVPQ